MMTLNAVPLCPLLHQIIILSITSPTLILSHLNITGISLPDLARVTTPQNNSCPLKH
jgi:hypothetical protein